MILISISIGCQDSGVPVESDEAKKEEILRQKEEIKSTLMKMWEAIENEDIEHYASYIHPEFTQFGETDPTLNEGKEMEVNGVREWLKNSSNIGMIGLMIVAII